MKLFDVIGGTGPVVSDTNGNVFLAVDVEGPLVCTITATQALQTAAVADASVVPTEDKNGIATSLAVSSKKGAGSGWLFSEGSVDPGAPTVISAFATAYTVASGTINPAGSPVANAIVPSGENTMSLFNSPTGDIWVAVEGSGATNWFVQLSQ